MLTNYTFSKRLGVLIGIDVMIALVGTYVPQDWRPARDALDVVQLAFMAWTMAVAMRRVLEDY